MKRKLLTGLLTLLGPLFVVVIVTASPGAPTLDCEALQNSYLAEPEGYAEQCGGAAAAASHSARVPLDPTDSANVVNLRGGFDYFGVHVLNNFPGVTNIATFTANVYGMDFDSTATTLYALNQDTLQLGTINTTNGVFTPIAPLTLPTGHSLTALAIDPITDAAYVATSNGTVTAIHSLNLTTGALVTLGNTGTALMIALAIDCRGMMYGHDIGTDSIYTVDTATGVATLVGATGIAANFARGMEFDNDEGTLYIYAYVGSGNNTYGTVDLLTGQVTPLSVDNPIGEFEGAVRTTCPLVPAIAVAKTVSLDGSCGTANTINAPFGANVTYCYQVTNTGDVTLTHHTVDDDVLGPILTNFPYNLAPGGSAFVTQTYTFPGGDVTNIMTWTAYVSATTISATASATATVLGLPTDVMLTTFTGQASGFSMNGIAAAVLAVALFASVVLIRRRQYK